MRLSDKRLEDADHDCYSAATRCHYSLVVRETRTLKWADEHASDALCPLSDAAGYKSVLIIKWRRFEVCFLAQILSSLFSMLNCRWTPESARWLLVNGQVEKAQLYLNKCAKINKRPPPAKSKLEACLSSLLQQITHVGVLLLMWLQDI